MREDTSSRDEAGTSPDGSSERLSELFDVLSHRRRRCALACLRSCETPMSLSDLTDEVVRRQTDASPTEGDERRDHVRISLYHLHLPKLADADLVSFDTDELVVDLRSHDDDDPLGTVRRRVGEWYDADEEGVT